MEKKKINIKDINYIVLDTELFYHIRKFLERVTPTLPSSYLQNLQINLETLKVKNALTYHFLHNISNKGKYEINYDINKNKIKYNNDFIYLIYQELFHVATTRVGKNVTYQGLSIGLNKDKKRRGRGFDAGYTLYLTELYFCDENKGEFYGKHEKTKDIMKKIDNLIGHDQVLYCYMNNDLVHFQRYLSNYGTDYDVEYLTNIMDSLKDAEDKNDFIKIGSMHQQVLKYNKYFEKEKDNKKIRLIMNK